MKTADRFDRARARYFDEEYDDGPLWPGKAAVLSKRMLRDSREPAYRVPSSCASPPLLHCAAWPGKAAVLSSASCATAASLPAACLRTADEAAGIPRREQRNERRKRDAV